MHSAATQVRKPVWFQYPVSELTAGGVACLVAAVISLACPYAPSVHDEFSTILAADTLLHGRLANPSPEVWQPFQSFHILVEPTYASKYPLGPALCVALGWAVLGQPLAGSWLAAGLCAACITWMLRGLTVGRWALLGGLLVALHPAMQTTWSQSLISGWLTASASALLAGGIFRLRRRYAFWPALAVGSGVAGLALTRPFEGLVATLLSGAALLYWWSARGWLSHQGLGSLGRLVGVSSLPVGLALAAILAQNYATSGSLTRMPYQLHEQYYGVAPLFVFGHEKTGDMERAGELPGAIHRYHHGWSLDSFRRRMGLSGWLRGIQETWQLIWNYWFLFAAVAALTSPFWWRLRVPASLAVMMGGQVLCSSCVCWIFPHYLSPMLPWLLALTIVGSRSLMHRLRHFPATSTAPKRAAWFAPGSGGWTRFVVPAILTLQLAWLSNAAQQLPLDPSRNWARQRAAIDADLRRAEGKHLVLVTYAPEHNVHQEWVYNRADLESDKVLWARDDRPEWTQRLLKQYGRERYVWRLEPDGAAPELKLIDKPSPSPRTID